MAGSTCKSICTNRLSPRSLCFLSRDVRTGPCRVIHMCGPFVNIFLILFLNTCGAPVQWGACKRPVRMACTLGICLLSYLEPNRQHSDLLAMYYVTIEGVMLILERTKWKTTKYNEERQAWFFFFFFRRKSIAFFSKNDLKDVHVVW